MTPKNTFDALYGECFWNKFQKALACFRFVLTIFLILMIPLNHQFTLILKVKYLHLPLSLLFLKFALILITF